MEQQGIRVEASARIVIRGMHIADNGRDVGTKGIGVYLHTRDGVKTREVTVRECVICDSGAGFQGEAFRDEGEANRFENNTYSGSLAVGDSTIVSDNSKVPGCPAP